MKRFSVAFLMKQVMLSAVHLLDGRCILVCKLLSCTELLLETNSAICTSEASGTHCHIHCRAMAVTDKRGINALKIYHLKVLCRALTATDASGINFGRFFDGRKMKQENLKCWERLNSLICVCVCVCLCVCVCVCVRWRQRVAVNLDSANYSTLAAREFSPFLFNYPVRKNLRVCIFYGNRN